MKKATKILGMLAASILAIGSFSCSDNLDTDLEPNKYERTLSVMDAEGKEFSNHTLNLGAAPSSIAVKVESNTRWAVEITDCVGGWCDVDVFNASGDGSFTITVLDNMKEERNCYVTVYKTDAQGNKETDGSYQLKVHQAVSDVRLSPSSLPSFAPSGNSRQEFNIISNVAWTLDVTYEAGSTAKFVTITPSETMTANGDGTFRGNGAASFYLQILDNRTTAGRKAYLNLHSEVADYEVELTQLGSEYSFDVSPAEPQTIAPEGGQIQFAVQSLSAWDIECVYPWISFPNWSFESSKDPIGIIATVSPNMTGRERNAVIHFKPRESNYQPLDVQITQIGYDLIFSASLNGDAGVVMESATSKHFDIDTRFNWEVTTPDRWMHTNPAKGTGSQTIIIDIDRNTDNANRTGIITITPLPTEFPGGVTLSPRDMGIEPIHFSITQFGGREAAISVPWLVDGYGQTYATVEFNYYSPFAEVTAAGLQWRKAGTEEWITVNASISNPIEGVVSVDLRDLDPATHYEARGFVMDNTGRTIYGTVSYPFTTAGYRPGAGDNPTPTRKR